MIESTYRLMTQDERKAAYFLGLCTFRAGSYDKRFAEHFALISKCKSGVITEQQSRTLWKLFYTYRRQITKGKRPTVEVRLLLDYAKPIYDQERTKKTLPDTQEKLKKWQENSHQWVEE